MICVHIEGRGPLELNEDSPASILIDKLHLTSADSAIAIKINGRLVDFSSLLKNQDVVEIFSFDTKEGKEVFWHSSAHVLAQAILRLFPEAKPTIGPPIENGFYYDFANLKISDEDFTVIEEEMEKICRDNLVSEKISFSSKADAKSHFLHNPYKLELIDSFDTNAPLTAYRQGEFVDLCRGPHLMKTGKIKALKVLKTSGAYWKGDSQNEMLTRIYAITFPDRKDLKAYLFHLEEAKKRDHKILGPQLGLFSLHEEAPGLPFMHPKGMNVWNRLVAFWRELHHAAGYVEIKTPTLMSKELWQTSGHWDNYRANMYTTSIEERDFAIKPMNCPGCMIYYKGQLHSYRDLPLRVAEIGLVHRYEASGALSGLFRVRGFHQDDAHLFVKPEEIDTEVAKVLDLVETIYSTFGLSYHLELSTKPDSNTIGSDDQWQMATQGLKNALSLVNKSYKLNPGDGAFYGPKIDVHIKDAIGRTWQCATIQLDMALPERFELEYIDNEGRRQRPVMLHRAIFGSIERFFGILIEHFKGRFPFWISPHQIRLMPVADRHVALSNTLAHDWQKMGFSVDVDDSHESISKKVRSAQLLQINYMITIGDRELEQHSLSIRSREGKVITLSQDEFLERITQENEHKSLESSL
jgi:threonyl-tRNA synthetase